MVLIILLYKKTSLKIIGYLNYSNRIEYVSEATYKYNCHAYAWHISEGGSLVWINTPEDDKYWNDYSYVETPISSATKVSFGGPCYQTWRGEYQNACDHSAITTNTPNYFISKWGPSPRFRHHINDCPYSTEDLHYYVKLSISGNKNPYNFQQNIYTVVSVPANTTVTWSGSSNINFIGGQTGQSVTISICTGYAATLTAVLAGAVNDTLSRTLAISNGILTVVPQLGAIDVEYYHPYAQCYDWSIGTNLTSEIGSGDIPCTSTNVLTLEPLYNTEGGYIQVRARANGCYSSWKSGEVSIWHPEIDGTNSYLNPMSGEPFWVNLVEPVPDNGKIGTIQYYWYFDDTLFEITGEPYLHSYNWPCGDHQLTVVAHADDHEISTMTDFWGMCFYGTSSTAFLKSSNK